MNFDKEHDPNIYADSRATAHMVNNPGVMSKLKHYNGTSSIYVGNGEKLNISHVGNSMLNTKQGHLILKNILAVPNSKKNLLSVAQLTLDISCSIAFDSHGFVIKDRQGKIQAKRT